MFLRISCRVTTFGLRNFEIAGTTTIWRNVRSVVRRRPTDSIKTVKGKVETEYYSKFDEDYKNMENIKDLKRMARQIFVNTDETQTEAEFDLEEDCDAPIEHAEKFYHMNQQEEMQYKSNVRKKIIAKKYFKEPKETNLLCYAAKTQIRYLHKLDPIKWTPEKLAESFPISVKGVKRLLKNNFEMNEEKIKEHDANVVLRWQLLESGNTKTISPVTQHLYMEGKITKDHHAGNFSLPVPVPQEKVPKIKPKKIGEHAAMIKYYLDLKKSTDIKEVTLETTKEADTSLSLANDKTVKLSEYEQRDIQKSVLPEFKSIVPTRKEMEDMKSASYLAAEKPDQDEIEIPQAQFQENLLQEFAEKRTNSSIDIAYKEWIEKEITNKSEPTGRHPQPFDPKDFFETVKKFNGEAIELHRDENNTYLYDEQLGYQHPLGKEIIQRRIKIPPKKYVQGALYRVGQNFYADDGEFLYKVCV